MKTKTKLALAFLAIRRRRLQCRLWPPKGGGKGPGMRFERADADKSGDVSFEEFAAAMNARTGTCRRRRATAN